MGATDSMQSVGNELFYQSLIANSLDGILVVDEYGIISFASPSINQILGFKTEDVIGKKVFDFTHPDDLAVALSAFSEELDDIPTKKFISVRLIDNSENWIWCIVRGHNQFKNKYINGMVIYFYNDTPRKRIELSLIESENRFRRQASILKNVTDIIITTDLNGRVTSWNDITENLTGVTEREVMGEPFMDIIAADFDPFTYEQVMAIVVKEGIWRGEVSLNSLPGKKTYLLYTISLMQENDINIGFLGIGKDITDRKIVQAEIERSELFYRTLATQSLDGIVMTNSEGRFTYIGPSVKRISGYEPEQLLGHLLIEFIHPDDLCIALDAFQKEIEKTSDLNYVVIRLKHLEKGWTWSKIRAHNMIDNPVVNSLVIYFSDDTKRKTAEEKLRLSEKEFRSLIQNLRQGIIVQNAASKILNFNFPALKKLGLREDQLTGKSFFDISWDVIHEDGSFFPGHEYPAAVAIRTNKPVREVVMGLYRKDMNDRVWLLVNSEPVLDQDGKLENVITYFTDITEQKRLTQALIDQEIQKQKQITQATIDAQENERQEMGKELHDNINQHLNTTRLYLEVAREKASGDVLKMINLSHKSLTNIVEDIRHLSQSLVPPTLGDLGLVESIQDLCEALKMAHPFDIEFLHRQFLEEGMPENMKLMLFRIVQEQVNNIIKHAKATNIRIRLQSDAENILLTIEDNGEGFDPDNFKKGLGFNNIFNRASLFSGKVDIHSIPGSGCSVTVVIPLGDTE